MSEQMTKLGEPEMTQWELLTWIITLSHDAITLFLSIIHNKLVSGRYVIVIVKNYYHKQEVKNLVHI